MLSTLREYHRPHTVGEVLELLARPGVRTAILAGGTELAGREDPELEAVVDLAALGLNTVDTGAGGLRLGAAITLQDLMEHPDVLGFAGGLLAAAAKQAAPRTIRQAATLGGTLAGDKGGLEVPTALVALDARLTLAVVDGIRQVAVDEFLAGKGGWLAGALVTEVSLPLPMGGTGAALERVSRSPSDRAIICAAAVLSVDRHGACKAARVAIGGAGAHPGRVPDAEAELVGHPLTSERIAAAAAAVTAAVDPQSDFRASAEYRRWVAPVLVRRALTAAREVESR